MIQKILADRTGYQKVVAEQKNIWISEILEALGVDDDFFDLPIDYQRDLLIENEIQIIRYPDIDACMVIFEGNVIGEWLGPSLRLVEDDQGLYFEITLESWSILENQDDDD